MKQNIFDAVLADFRKKSRVGLSCALVALLFFSASAFAQETDTADGDAIQLQQEAPAALLGAPAVSEVPATSSASEPPSLSDILKSIDDEKSEAKVSAADPAALEQAFSGGGFAPPPAVSEEDEALQLRKEAFDSVIGGMMPMTPAEIRRAMELYDETQQAVETPIYPSPEPESSFVQASLEPGSKPVLIKTAVGNVTTVSIVDATGKPWPIQDMTWAGDFQVEQPEAGSHMLRISPQSHFAQGNVSMRLVGLNPPVIFSLRTERKTVHVRLDVQIPEVGPNGVLPPVITPVSIKAGDEAMTKVLLGIPSQAGLKKLTVEGVDGRTSAYQSGASTYVRTPYTLLSPSWSKSVQSADGMHVYMLDSTPVLLLSDKGKMLRAYLSPMEQSNGQ